MKNIENQNFADYRGQVLDRMKTRFPDRNFEAQEGQNAQDDLDQAVIEVLTEMGDREKVYNENTERLNNLLMGSPRTAVFINELARTGNPGAAIRKAYGKDAYDAYNEGDASAIIAEIEAEDEKLRAEDENYQKEKEANMAKSFDDLGAYCQEKGLDKEQTKQLFSTIYGYFCDAAMGIYPRELFDLVYKAQHYDADVASARQDGEVEGRNAKIRTEARRKQDVASMPPALSGQGAPVSERKPERKSSWGDFLK